LAEAWVIGSKKAKLQAWRFGSFIKRVACIVDPIWTAPDLFVRRWTVEVDEAGQWLACVFELVSRAITQNLNLPPYVFALGSGVT
jgi:hypothetical protein